MRGIRIFSERILQGNLLGFVCIANIKSFLLIKTFCNNNKTLLTFRQEDRHMYSPSSDIPGILTWTPLWAYSAYDN